MKAPSVGHTGLEALTSLSEMKTPKV